jgi:flagellar hook assembly protein FlgD
MGKQVRTFDRGEENPGIKSIVWDGADDFGNPVSAGIYLFQIQTGDFTQTRKMILLK